MKIKSILLVDDDGEYMNELKEYLIQKDFNVIKKNDTRRILPFIKKTNPDLIIMDYKINGLTGIDVSRILNSNSATKNIPIILVSNYHDSESYEHAQTNSSIRIYLKKSINPELLLKEIRNIEDN